MEVRGGPLSQVVLIGFLYLLASNFEPLRNFNEAYPVLPYSTLWYLVLSIFLVSCVASFAFAFHKGKSIRKPPD